MILDIPDGFAVLWSVISWAGVSLLVGVWATRLPIDRLAVGPVTRLRPWEREGRRWDRLLAVRRWKDLVPEAGGWMGGRTKRGIGSRSTDDLRRFTAETVRAERVHWLILSSTPLHAVWCRPNILVGMVAFGIVANAPCVLIQRYNRGRLERILRRRSGRVVEPDGPPAPAHPPEHERRDR